MRRFWSLERIIGVWAVFLLYTYPIMAENSFRVMSYNVENFFHPVHDSLKNDWDFTKEGTHHWTFSKYYQKADKITRVIANVGEWNKLAIIGLCEIENEQCCKELCYRMRNYHYAYIHYESPDARGVDVAMIYDSLQFRVLESEPIRVTLDSITFTRDILYAKGIMIATKDTLHVMICHLPSQLGGRAESQWKRDKALAAIQARVDSLYYTNENTNIIVMGDFNDDRQNQISNMRKITTVSRGSYDTLTTVDGTHKYNGIWSELDQFYVSVSLYPAAKAYIYAPEWLLEYDKKYLGYKPKRTYIGYHYNKDGYSDHLPIVMQITGNR